MPSLNCVGSFICIQKDYAVQHIEVKKSRIEPAMVGSSFPNENVFGQHSIHSSQDEKKENRCPPAALLTMRCRETISGNTFPRIILKCKNRC